MTTPRKTRLVAKNAYRDYIVKASEFARTMTSAYELRDWNSTGLAAVHCVISANDALLAYFGGVRSVSPNHDDAGLLLVEAISGADVKGNAIHLRRVIARKNLIEYESRLFTHDEAEKTLKHAERFFAWAIGRLPPQL